MEMPLVGVVGVVGGIGDPGDVASAGLRDGRVPAKGGEKRVLGSFGCDPEAKQAGARLEFQDTGIVSRDKGLNPVEIARTIAEANNDFAGRDGPGLPVEVAG
jgi:hypothetical protein